MKNFENWKNKNVLITGGTSGLGYALVNILSQYGANVATLARNQSQLSKLKYEFPKLLTLNYDISKMESIYPISGEIHSQFGHLDVLFNVASYLGETPLRPLIDSDCKDFEKVLQTNVLGPFRLTKAFLPSMFLNNKGFVVNISSDASLSAYPNWGAYGTSKAALDHMSRIWNEESKTFGVRFLSIDPGDMNTPMHFAALPDADIEKLKDPVDSARSILSIIDEKSQFVVRRSV